MTKDKIDHYYMDAVAYVVDVCMTNVGSKTATRLALRGKLSKPGVAAIEAQGQLRDAIHDYYSSPDRKRPVRISTTTTVVILDRSTSWIRKHRDELGYDPSHEEIELYDYEKVCSVVGGKQSYPGKEAFFIVDGKVVVGTPLRVCKFASIGDALQSGARLRAMSVEQALSMPWYDHDDKRVWGRAYVNAITRLVESTAKRPE